MMRHGLPIGVASTRSGVKVPTIRYYEQIGLLPKPPRTKSNRRENDADDLRRLIFIRHARDLGFSIEQVRELGPGGSTNPILRRGGHNRARALGRGRAKDCRA
jgi:DNA-binding transcriptional MerR regulator